MAVTTKEYDNRVEVIKEGYTPLSLSKQEAYQVCTDIFEWASKKDYESWEKISSDYTTNTRV